MKFVLFFLFTCFVSTGAFMAALGSKHPLILYAVGFGMWGLFTWFFSVRLKKQTQRREMENQFRNFMRQQNRNFK